jgi:methanogenic corrinoid protein MtbC1
LSQIVEGEIIPRLLLAHGTPSGPDGSTLSQEFTESFALYALSQGRESLLAIVGSLLQKGVSIESIYLDLLAPAARRLGDLWLDDRASYADVTIALGRLQQIVRELSARPAGGVCEHAALFAPAPGEQHTFGLVLLEEFFRRSGWRTWSELSGACEEVASAARAHRFDVFGVTASHDNCLDQIASLIMSVRRVSKNRDICVLVGGRLFLARPELVAEVGADATAADAQGAVFCAEAAVRRLVSR